MLYVPVATEATTPRPMTVEMMVETDGMPWSQAYRYIHITVNVLIYANVSICNNFHGKYVITIFEDISHLLHHKCPHRTSAKRD